MKKYLSFLFVLCIVFSSCTKNEENSNLLPPTLQQELSKNNSKGVLSLGNVSIVVKDDNSYVKFKNAEYHYNFSYTKDIKDNFILSNSNKTFSTESNDVGVSSVSIIEEGESYVLFDLKTTSGFLIKGIRYDSNESIISKSACPWCWVIPIVVEAVIEVSDDDYDSNCKAAIEAVKETCTGLIKIKITEGGWFGGASCEAECVNAVN